jgi:hypothetical protein
MIGQARFIVADLTNERPNVYFELGYARGLGKTVITILRSGTNIHFDVRDWTYTEYFDSRPLENDLLQRFEFELQRSLYPVALQAVARTPGSLSGHNGPMTRAAGAPISHVTDVAHCACRVASSITIELA